MAANAVDIAYLGPDDELEVYLGTDLVGVDDAPGARCPSSFAIDIIAAARRQQERPTHVRGVPLLPSQAHQLVPYFDVKYIWSCVADGPNVRHSVTFRLQKWTLNIVGFKSGEVGVWYEFRPEVGAVHEIPGSTFLRFIRDYSQFGLSGCRASLVLCKFNAINNLMHLENYRGEVDPKRVQKLNDALLFMVVLTAENPRLKRLMDHINTNWDRFPEPEVPVPGVIYAMEVGTELEGLQNDWGTCSDCLQDPTQKDRDDLAQKRLDAVRELGVAKRWV